MRLRMVWGRRGRCWHMISGALWGAGWNHCCQGPVRVRPDQLAPVAALHRDLRVLRVVFQQGALALRLMVRLVSPAQVVRTLRMALPFRG